MTNDRDLYDEFCTACLSMDPQICDERALGSFPGIGLLGKIGNSINHCRKHNIKVEFEFDG